MYVIKGRGPCSNSAPVPPSSLAREAWLRTDLSALSLSPGFSFQWGAQSWLDLHLEMRWDSLWHKHMALVMVQTTPLFAPVPPSPSLPSSDWESVRLLGWWMLVCALPLKIFHARHADINSLSQSLCSLFSLCVLCPPVNSCPPYSPFVALTSLFAVFLLHKGWKVWPKPYICRMVYDLLD